MNRKFTTFSTRLAATLLAVALLAGCIDDSYDLSNLDSDSIGLGTDDTSFDMPLVEVIMEAEEALSSDTKAATKSSEDEITETTATITSTDLEKLNALLPTGYELDFSRIENDSEYASQVASDLIDEIQSDEDKSKSFYDEITTNNSDGKYKDLIEAIETDLGSGVLDNFDSFNSAIQNTTIDNLPSTLPALTDTIVVQIKDKTTTTVEAGLIDIGSETLDFLNKNIDGDKNTLTLFAVFDHDIDLDIDFAATIEYSGGDIILPDYADADNEDVEANDDGLITTGDVLEQILDNLTLDIKFNITNYDASKSDYTKEKTIVLTIIARKAGSLVF